MHYFTYVVEKLQLFWPGLSKIPSTEVIKLQKQLQKTLQISSQNAGDSRNPSIYPYIHFQLQHLFTCPSHLKQISHSHYCWMWGEKCNTSVSIFSSLLLATVYVKCYLISKCNGIIGFGKNNPLPQQFWETIVLTISSCLKWCLSGRVYHPTFCCVSYITELVGPLSAAFQTVKPLWMAVQLTKSTIRTPKADSVSGICNFSSYLFSIRSSYKLSVVTGLVRKW